MDCKYVCVKLNNFNYKQEEKFALIWGFFVPQRSLSKIALEYPQII